MGRRRIDWIAAKLAFVSDPTRSFPKVAREFGVSDTAVRKHGNAEGWEAEAIAFDKRMASRALAKVEKTREQRIAAYLRAVDLGLQKVIDDLVSGNGDAKLSDLPGLMKIAELLTGQATDRVDAGQVQQVLAVVLQLGARELPREQFLAEFDRAVQGVLEAGPAQEDVT